MLKSRSSRREPPGCLLGSLESFESDMKRSINKGIIASNNTCDSCKDLPAIRKRPGCGLRSDEKVSEGCVGLISQV